MKTIEGNFDNPEVNQLLKKHFIELRSVSPEGSTHVLDIEGLQDKSIKFWSIYENDELPKILDLLKTQEIYLPISAIIFLFVLTFILRKFFFKK